MKALKKVIAIGGAGLILAAVTAWTLDKLYPLPDVPTDSTVIRADDGTILRAFVATDGQWRFHVTPEEVSPVYLQELLNFEDRAFYHHPGINPLALARALVQNLKAGSVVSGGSTLTMQVAGLIDPYPHTLAGKLKQAARAVQLEWHYSKREILEIYLNHAPYGGILSGVQSASYAYFGRSAAELSDAQAALLAVLPQRPSGWRPDRFPQAARQARDKVLRRMGELDVWPQSRVNDALIEPVAALPPQQNLLSPLLARRLYQQCPDCRSIDTFIDAPLQRQLQGLARDYLHRLTPQQNISIIVVRNRDRAVRAYLGSASFGDQQRLGYIDMAQAVRSPGSTLKPFLYGMAMDRGLINSQSLLMDTPRYRRSYQPRDFSGGFAGPVSATDALQRSLNIPAVELMEHLGSHRFAAALNNAGMTLHGPGAKAPNPAMILGGVGATLEDLVGGYSALANRGQAGAIRLTADQPRQSRWLMSPEAAWITWRMLAHDPYRGLQRVGRSQWNLAWKTGTSYGYRDAWAIGVSPKWTIGVWIGRADGSPSPGSFGAVTSVPLLLRVYSALTPNSESPLPKPDSVIRQTICWPLGTALADPRNSGDNCMQKKEAWTIDGVSPQTLLPPNSDPIRGLVIPLLLDDKGKRVERGCSDTVASAEQRVIWPEALTPWLRKSWKAENRLPKAAPGCDLANTTSLKITSVESGSQLFIPAGRDQLHLKLAAQGGKGTRQWYIDGRWIGSDLHGTPIIDWNRTGADQQLSVVDESGHTDMVSFSVKQLH